MRYKSSNNTVYSCHYEYIFDRNFVIFLPIFLVNSTIIHFVCLNLFE